MVEWGGQRSRRRIPAGGNVEQPRGKLAGVDWTGGLSWATALCPIPIWLLGYSGKGARCRQGGRRPSPQPLDETLGQILRVLDINDYCPAVDAVFFQVLVKLGIIISSDVTSEIFSRGGLRGGHLVIVKSGRKKYNRREICG